jgi:[ribosomal protein S18]-alanine N-acetyltransferase
VGRAHLEIRHVTPALREGLEGLFSALRAAGDEKWFHPHPLSDEEAAKVCRYKGEDLYYVLAERDKVLAYGLLSGWEKGFPIPSLGIAVSPEFRGVGLGRVFMSFLHAAARRKGAKSVRLKVHPDNGIAIKLYRALGYRFVDQEEEQLVGLLPLE